MGQASGGMRIESQHACFGHEASEQNKPSGGLRTESQHACFCMMDKNHVNRLFCQNCENWYHAECVLISEEEYEEILRKMRIGSVKNFIVKNEKKY